MQEFGLSLLASEFYTLNEEDDLTESLNVLLISFG